MNIEKVFKNEGVYSETAINFLELVQDVMPFEPIEIVYNNGEIDLVWVSRDGSVWIDIGFDNPGELTFAIEIDGVDNGKDDVPFETIHDIPKEILEAFKDMEDE